MSDSTIFSKNIAPLGTPWWWEAVAPDVTPDALPPICDVLVIGAGYTGLSAAIAAHDCGAQVVVVDADIPGIGASSRNGGMVGAHPRLNWEELSQKFGGETADAIFAEAGPALNWAISFMEDEGIDCDFEQTGRIQLAWTPNHYRGQKTLEQSLCAKSTVQAKALSRDELSQEIGTERYHGGLLFPEHGALHPAKYHNGMLAAVQRRGIPVVSQARVEKLEQAGPNHLAHTTKGQIKSDKVVLATNGYTTRAFRWHAARVFPLPSYLIATEALPDNVIGHLAPGRRMMVETRARHSYFRIAPDGKRILFGGRASMRNLPLSEAARRLHATMTEVWPELADTKLTHAWSGNTGYTFTHMPHVGERDGVCFAMGFSGSGTVMAPYLGAKAGYLAVGDNRAETAYRNTYLPRHVMHPFQTPHFLKAADFWYRQWIDRVENRHARSTK